MKHVTIYCPIKTQLMYSRGMQQNMELGQRPYGRMESDYEEDDDEEVE